MKPSCAFVENLKWMETLFKTYHGENSLKPGKASVMALTNDIAAIVSLPKDVITFFVRYRTFFRICILNQNMIQERRNKNKKKKKKS